MLAPALKYLADALALSWRKRLTSVAHRRYLTGSTFYGASHLAGMQVSPGDRLPRTLPGAFRELQGHIPAAHASPNRCAPRGAHLQPRHAADRGIGIATQLAGC